MGDPGEGVRARLRDQEKDVDSSLAESSRADFSYFANYGDDLHACGSLAPILDGYIGCIVIRPDSSRVLARAVGDPQPRVTGSDSGSRGTVGNFPSTRKAARPPCSIPSVPGSDGRLTAMIQWVQGRAPFLVMNRTVNRALRAVLRSPLHGVASGRVALISYTGRRSGRKYTIPVFYRDKGDELTIAVGWPGRKVWWRNLTGGGGPVRLVVKGQELRGHAIATRDPGRDALVRVRFEGRV